MTDSAVPATTDRPIPMCDSVSAGDLNCMRPLNHDGAHFHERNGITIVWGGMA